jgi:hypothetical protein
MTNLTTEDIKYIAKHLYVKTPNKILIYINIFLILIFLYLLYINVDSSTKYNRKLFLLDNELNKIINGQYELKRQIFFLKKPIEHFKSTDPRYLVSRSEKNTDNTNLIETTGLEFYSNPYLEDNRLINALNDL